jgi:hypothetical protein
MKEKKTINNAASGQSLVEFAVILPILLLMMIGVFEVGWALRGYLTLVNANREAARFASRGVYLDLDEKESNANVGYSKITTHTMDTLASQLATINFIGNGLDNNAAMITTFYSVEPGVFTCPGDPTCAAFDCKLFLDPGYDPGGAVIALNDVEYPLLIPPVGFESQPDIPAYYNTRVASDTQVGLLDHYDAITAYHYHTGGPYFSRINPTEMVEQFRTQANHLNCERVKKGLPEDQLAVIVVENFFLQDLLVGMPFVTVFIGDKIPMYTYSSMRINPSAREQDDNSNVACTLYPLMIPSSEVSGRQFGEQPVQIPIAEGNHNRPGRIGFVQWDGSAAVTIPNLEDDFANPVDADEEFSEPASNPPDTEIGIGDLVRLNNQSGVVAAVEDDLQGLIGTDMLLPVWNDSDCLVSGAGTCSNAPSGAYEHYSYVRMRLIAVYLDGNSCDTSGDKCLEFQFIQPEPNACPEAQS